jgi:hypothetical protein
MVEWPIASVSEIDRLVEPGADDLDAVAGQGVAIGSMKGDGLEKRRAQPPCGRPGIGQLRIGCLAEEFIDVGGPALADRAPGPAFQLGPAGARFEHCRLPRERRTDIVGHGGRLMVDINATVEINPSQSRSLCRSRS